jgi:hypothetical protein
MYLCNNVKEKLANGLMWRLIEVTQGRVLTEPKAVFIIHRRCKTRRKRSRKNI